MCKKHTFTENTCEYPFSLLHAYDRKNLDMQIKLATRMALIVGTDFICWMPIIIMGLLSATGAAEIPADVYAWTAVFILPLNSSLNPYLYTFSVAWQRRKAKQRSSTTGDTLDDKSRSMCKCRMSPKNETAYFQYLKFASSKCRIFYIIS